MKKTFVVVVIGLIATAFIIPFYIPQEAPYLAKLQLILTALITLLLPFIILCLIFAAWITRHLYVKLERMNIGGINLLFHKPDRIFLNSAKAFLETKRTLYKIEEDFDNFNETLDSYFATYQFFRKEMTILDSQNSEQKKLYDLSSKIIAKLNLFLTEHQSNYRRWYNQTVEQNLIYKLQDEGKEEVKKPPHMMKIGELQKYYYDYDEIVNGFKSVNSFFRAEVNEIIKVDMKKWERE
ncbi:hypothetical protein ANABIO32_04170 [Rossellomorea marisflavi]|uniref:hypothetical protein n=1 Tax=Rossellomorea marisflavi TaxID=189381 RepID=UPI0025CADB88|nr:hypothetical protein [Rossellomorea marisflavi]GLI82730.1 hypothetical protein ANABIO32_04170 [Rossellomorea marisflavi]